MSSADIVPLSAGEVAAYGPTFLMCSPDLYEVNYVINPWMAGQRTCFFEAGSGRPMGAIALCYCAIRAR